MHEIAPDIFTFTGLLMGRVYALVEGGEVTLIDAGLESAAPKVLAQLRAAGHAPEAVKRILVTHAHLDHVGGLQALHAATGAELFASAEERRVIEGEIAAPLPPRQALGGSARSLPPAPSRFEHTPVARVLAGGDRFPDLLSGLEVIETPGHAPGHLSFWLPARGVLFTGDVVLNLGSLRLPFAAFTVDMDENRRSVAKIAALDPTLLCFGHGPPLGERAAEKLRAFAQKVALP